MNDQEKLKLAQEIVFKTCNYKFHNISYLQKAITHKSIVNGSAVDSYERLEFLGDALLEMIVSEEIYENYRELDEGNLTELRKNIVSAIPLFKACKKMGLDESIIAVKNTNGKKMLSDVIEAIMAAIYIDSKNVNGLEKGYLDAKAFIFNILKNEITNAIKNGNKDPISILNEKYVKAYRFEVAKEGQDHCPRFTASLYINDELKCVGSEGLSKKEAERNCAIEFLSTLQ